MSPTSNVESPVETASEGNPTSENVNEIEQGTQPDKNCHPDVSRPGKILRKWSHRRKFQQNSTKSGSIFQFFMTGESMEGVMTPTKKRSPMGSAGSYEDIASPRRVTIWEAIEEKYSPSNFTMEHFSPMGGVSPVKVVKEGGGGVVSATMSPNLCLEDCNIGYAGDSELLCKYCANVRDLDLSHNDLQSWHEVVKILREMPNLTRFNLAHNRKLSDPYSFSAGCSPTNEDTDSGSGSKQIPVNCFPSKNANNQNQKRINDSEDDSDFVHDYLKTLVLINTGVTLHTVAQLMPRLPALEELHLSLNEYRSIDDSVMDAMVPHKGLKTLYFTDNEISDWRDIVKLSRMFPSLKNLFIASNKLPAIDVSLQGHFTQLHSLHMAGNCLDTWECLDELNSLPNLRSVRMVNIPFFDQYDPDPAIRRNLCIARLQHVEVLNGSVVTQDNRIDAERFLIRHCLDLQHKPDRYFELVDKYGQLQKLGEVDLSPVEQISLQLHCDAMEIQTELQVKPSITVQQLKASVSQVIGLGVKDFDLQYRDDVMLEAYGPDCCFCPLNLMSIQLSTAGLCENCELHVITRL